MYNYDIKCKVIEEELRSVWPEWHVIGRLGGGAFGDVFQIYKEKYGIRVESALKVIQIIDNETTKTQPLNDPDATEDETAGQNDIPDSLRREIEIMETLRGAPNVVNIEDFYFRREGTTCSLFVRMELLTSLKEVLSGGNVQHTLFSIQEIRKLGKDICTALMHCENKGIIHWDIKPANLFVDKFGHYKVGDFGASKRMDTVHESQTMTGIGTISYMAPEIFRGRSYNNTVDIYALGLVLYQLLNNGRLPFLPTEGSYTAQDIDNANYMRLHGTPLPGLERKAVKGERIDSRLDAVVRKACAVDPADRYQTAKEFYDALIFTETEEKNEEKSGSKQQGISSSEIPLVIQQRENRHPVGKKLLFAVVPLFILVVAGLAVLLGRNRVSSGAGTNIVEQKDVVEIPDPVLKKAIQDALEIGDREIRREDALSLTALRYNNDPDSESKIKNIKGLSAFKNLERLSLVYNEISDISELSSLTNLTALFLDSNEISDISMLPNLINLEALYIGNNQIRDISAISGMTNLKRLGLYNNPISEFDSIFSLPNLTALELGTIQISDISALISEISSLTNLTSLYLIDSGIRDISELSSLENLRSLYLYNNEISDISAISGMKNLVDLDLEFNQISDISALSGLTSLEYLELDNNQISDISALSGLTNLTHLNLEDNQISDISVLSGLTNLTILFLADNQISDISALSGLKNLEVLYLKGNPVLENKSREEIMEVLSGAENLRKVDF